MARTTLRTFPTPPSAAQTPMRTGEANSTDAFSRVIPAVEMRESIAGSIVVAAALVFACACGSKKPAEAPPPRTVSSSCPDLTKADEVGAFDFAGEYALSRDAADKLKAAALAAVEVEALGEKLDAELGIACSQIAHDLGETGDWRSGNEACAAAVKAVHDARAKLGPKAVTKLVVRTPVCVADASMMTKCASICDSSVPAEKVKADCDAKAGRCDGDCGGVCESKAPSACAGECAGTCEGTMKGTCGGRCRGRCDGKPVNGACPGECAGTCDRGPIEGACAGTCAGSCKLDKAGICEGVCAGACTVELSDAKCAGEFKTPDVSTDCRARCELAVINDRQCSVPQVGLVITGARDRSTEGAMKSAIDKSFPSLLKILFEVGEAAPKRVLNAQAIIESTRTGFKDLARSGGGGTAAASEAQLAKCFDEPFKKAAAVATTVKTGLDQASGVRDEATK